MTDSDERQTAGEKTKRGEAAWKVAKDAIAERNAQARKAAKPARDAHARQMAERRRRLS